VLCVNKDKGAVANKACKASCIGCGKCAKACKFEAITVDANVAHIDADKCKMCLKCVDECPKGAIHAFNFPPRKPKPAATDATVVKPAAPAAPKAEAPKVEAAPVSEQKVEVKQS
jgi:ferredoxin